MRLEEHSQLLRFAYVVLAALSGAFTALTFVRWKDMSTFELTLTIVGGFSFAIFVTPWFAHEIMRINETNTRAIAAMTYVFGSGSNILLPMLIGWIKRSFGKGDAA